MKPRQDGVLRARPYSNHTLKSCAAGSTLLAAAFFASTILFAAADSAHPEEIDTLFQEGLRLLRENRPEEARQPLEEAAAREPTSAAIHCNLGLAYANSRDLEQAVNEFVLALRFDEHMPEAMINLAGCYQSLGKRAQALEWYQKYLTENPADEEVADTIRAIKAGAMEARGNPADEDYYGSLASNQRCRWPTEKVPLKVFLDRNSRIKEFRESFPAVLLRAFEEWSTATDGRLRFTETLDPANADIICRWVDSSTVTGIPSTAPERGVSRLDASGGVIFRAKLKVLVAPVLGGGTITDDEVYKSCLHEVGHVLGLNGHSPNNRDVMFFTIDSPTVMPQLSGRDKATIRRLYDVNVVDIK